MRGKKQRVGEVRDKESPRETKGASRREFMRERMRVKKKKKRAERIQERRERKKRCSQASVKVKSFAKEKGGEKNQGKPNWFHFGAKNSMEMI